GYSDVTYNILDPRVSRRAAVGHFRVVSSAKGPKVDLAEARRRIRLVVDDIDEAYTQAAFEFQNDRFGSRVVADLQRAQFDASQIESDVTQGDILNLDQDAYNLHLQINEIADRADQLGASFRLQRLFVRIGDDINFLRELVQ
ncbi:MAG: hypothetical protein KDD25_00460, partial [Bdellovibrionales bacterium]|nr:hypothetical protein [Bdellovibrionales bacterium]